MTLANKLNAKISAVCPIDSISIGDESDKTTWRIDFQSSATDAQKTAAQDILTVYDYAADTAWIDYQTQVRILLEKSDLVALRCIKAGITFPDVWRTYVAELRASAGTVGIPTGALPYQPPFPVGT